LTKSYRLGRDRKHGFVIETFDRTDICKDCSFREPQELYVTQENGAALCIKCCVHIHGRIWMNKNGN